MKSRQSTESPSHAGLKSHIDGTATSIRFTTATTS